MPGVQSRGATPWTSIVEGPDRYAHDAGVCHRCKDAPPWCITMFSKKNWSPLPKKKQFLLDAKNATDILIPLPKMPAPDSAPRRLDLWWQCPPPCHRWRRYSPYRPTQNASFRFVLSGILKSDAYLMWEWIVWIVSGPTDWLRYGCVLMFILLLARDTCHFDVGWGAPENSLHDKATIWNNIGAKICRANIKNIEYFFKIHLKSIIWFCGLKWQCWAQRIILYDLPTHPLCWKWRLVCHPTPSPTQSPIKMTS